MPDSLQQTLDAASAALAGKPSGELVAPAPVVDAWSLYEDKRKREAATTWQDSAGAAWRQDSLVDGAVANAIGTQFAPDPSYSVYEPNTFKALTNGIPPEYHKEFYEATSGAHAEFIRSRLMDKLADLQKLGDLGFVGNAGRIAMSLVQPEALAAGVLSGGLYDIFRGVKGVAGASRALEAARSARSFQAGEVAARQVAEAAAAEGTSGRVVSQLATAGAANAGLEKLRQSVNFERDNAAVLEAALVGTTFAAPFIALRAREMNKLVTTANLEHRVLGVIRKEREGTPLGPQDLQAVADYRAVVNTVDAVESGKVDAATHTSPLDDGMPNERTITAKNGESITLKYDPKNFTIRAHDPAGILVGELDAESKSGEPIQHGVDSQAAWMGVNESHRRQGINTAMNDFAVDKIPGYTRWADIFTPDGLAWLQGVDADARAFADAGKAKEAERVARMAMPEAHSEDAFVEGFLPASVGAAQVAPVSRSTVSPEFDLITAKANYRADIFSVLNGSTNPVIQELGHLLVKDAIGNSGTWAQGWTASELKKNIWRTQGGHFHEEARDAFNEVRNIRGLGPLDAMQAHRQFYEDVSRVARGDTETLRNNPDIAGPLTKAATAMKSVYANLAERAQKSGLEGAEAVTPSDTYVNRVWNHNNIREAVKQYGRDEVDRVLSAAIPGFRHDVAKAHSFLNAVRKLEFQHVLQDIQLHGKDMAALRAELNKAGLAPDEVNSIVDIMFQSKKAEPDAGNPTNLRYRLDLDENFSARMPDGTEFRVSDLLENDSRLLVDKYINSMGGHIALAEKGITSRAAFAQKLSDAKAYHDANHADDIDAAKFGRELQLSQDMYDNVTGRPMSTQSFNRLDRTLAAFRAYTRSTFLGQLGIASAFEMKNAIGLATVRAFNQQMPTFRGFLGALRSGKLPNAELAADIEAMSGFGLERAASYSRQHEISEFTYDRGLSGFENKANTVSHAVDIISGNAHFTSATRQFAAALFVQKHANIASGKLKLTESLKERLVHNGLNESEIPTVLADLKKFSTVDAKGSVKELDWEGWQQKHPESYDSYRLLMEREVRDAIQDHDIGETMPFMHTTVGKIFSELRSFNLAAHSKQFLKGLHYSDSTTAMTWTLSFMGEALAYSTQTAINFAHNPEELERRLSLERIAAAVIQRMSVLGITPMLLETGYFVGSGGDSLFKGGTVNTDNRNAFLTPSMAAANRALKGVSAGVGAVNPLASNRTTSDDMKALLGTLPGGNTWVMRNLNDYVSSQYPRKELQRQ